MDLVYALIMDICTICGLIMDICILFVALDLVCDLFMAIDHCNVYLMLYALKYVAIVPQMLALYIFVIFVFELLGIMGKQAKKMLEPLPCPYTRQRV